MPARRVWREVGGGALVFVLWQYLVWLTGRGPVGPARAHGLALWHLEGAWHLQVEPWLQGLALAHPGLLGFANWYYTLAHVAGAVLLLGWAWWQGWAVYQAVRVVLLGVTGLALLVQLWPTAPLRLLGVGLVDTTSQRGISIYQAAKGHVDVFSAFPSLHVGWALVLAWAVLRYGRGRSRLLALHAPLTLLAVVLTGNHSVLDCLAAAVLLGVVVQLHGWVLRAQERRLRRRLVGLGGAQRAREQGVLL